jgi:hypothetical protein
MPRDYQKGKIYKIVCNITNKIYIGSTCEPTLARRLSGHVQNFKKWRNGKCTFITSFEIIEGGDYYIELLEICPCTINEELLARERFYIKSIDCINKIKNLNRTDEEKKEYMKEYSKEYNKLNNDKIKEQNKEYKELNKDKIKEQNREYNKLNKDKIKEQKREYNKLNKDKIKEQKREYYNKNKDIINERRKLKKENSIKN